MVIEGYTVRALYGYKPNTIPALKWIKRSNGYWAARDYGVTQDRYETEIEIQDTYANLKDFVAMLKANREDLSITLGTGEEIFGADVIATSCTVKEFDLFKRDSFKVYSLGMKIRALGPTFTGSADFTVLHPQDQYTSDTFVSVFKQDSYTGSFSYADRGIDTGVFKVQFRQNTAEMRSIRRFLMTEIRGGAVTVPDFSGITDLSTGKTYAFGPGETEGPFRAKIVNWRELGRRNFQDWILEIEFLQDIPHFPAASGEQTMSGNWDLLSAGSGARTLGNFKIGRGRR